MKTALLVGIPVIAFGFTLMFWHLRQWNSQQGTVQDARERAFFGRQFRRRALIGSLIAIVGSVITFMQWVSDPIIFFWAVVILLLLLLFITLIALLDLFYGVLHSQHGPEAQKARRALITEYLRARERAQKSDSSPPDENNSP